MSNRKPPRVWAVLYADGMVLDAFTLRESAIDRKRRWEAAGNVRVHIVRYDLHTPKPKAKARKR